MPGDSFRLSASAALRRFSKQLENDPVLMTLALFTIFLLFSMLAVFAAVIVAPALLLLGAVEGMQRAAPAASRSTV